MTIENQNQLFNMVQSDMSNKVWEDETPFRVCKGGMQWRIGNNCFRGTEGRNRSREYIAVQGGVK